MVLLVLLLWSLHLDLGILARIYPLIQKLFNLGIQQYAYGVKEGRTKMEEEKTKDDTGKPEEKHGAKQQHHKLPHPHCHGAKRAARRRRRISINRRAVSFLKKFALLVVFTDLAMAILESNLISTFILYLTLSSTFDVKPENVIESYCYSQSSGNTMCQSYMAQMTESPMLNRHDVDQPTDFNPPLSDAESYDLFLAFNKSFYDHPAKFRIQQNLGGGCMIASLYSKLAQQIFENITGTQIPPQSFDEFTQHMVHLGDIVPFTKALVSNSAPTYSEKIPQVMNAMHHGLENRGQHKNKRTGNYQLTVDEKGAIVVSEPYKNLIQIKDFMRHRWKRSNPKEKTMPRLSTTVATETSATEPQASATTKEPKPLKILSTENLTNMQADLKLKHNSSMGLIATELANLLDLGETLEGNSTEISGKVENINDTSLAKSISEKMKQGMKMLAAVGMSTTSPSPNPEPKKEPPRVVKSSKNKCTQGADREPGWNLKNLKTIQLLSEKGPRYILGLMEASLFNNWKCFIETVSSYMSPNQNGQESEIPDITKASCNLQDESELGKMFRGAARNGSVPTLGLDMNIFSAEVHVKAVRREKAIAQLFHDYGCHFMQYLSLYKGIPISDSFLTVYWATKVYSLAWNILICAILFYGTVYEDKTALNIWGMLSIMTSLLHFMIEDWINSSFNPEKTSIAIWFFVLYGLYKPLSILLVGTLGTEILGKDTVKRNKGFCLRVWQAFRGEDVEKSRPTLKTQGRPGWTGESRNVSGHFFMMMSGLKGKSETDKDAKGLKEDKELYSDTYNTTGMQVKVNRAMVDPDGNLLLYVHSPSTEDLRSGACIICGESSETLDIAESDQPDIIKESKEPEVLNSPNVHYRCSPGPPTEQYTDDEDFEIILDTSEDEDTDDDYNDDHPEPEEAERKKTGCGSTAGLAEAPGKTCNHQTTKMTDLPSTVMISERGATQMENGKHSQNIPGSPPPAYGILPDKIESKARATVNDGLIMKPIASQVDGNIYAPNAPVLDGANPHI